MLSTIHLQVCRSIMTLLLSEFVMKALILLSYFLGVAVNMQKTLSNMSICLHVNPLIPVDTNFKVSIASNELYLDVRHYWSHCGAS